ncbi:toxin-antitoxin system YwqK family antitoxin [Streptomyces sp. CA-132043]|uniref:toxin-antitoxin system YwqK family antitoxin n=1 Tax=Streptomyces sp. CA-132043 TaxID=3240048 RepID=UPI003D8A42FA
MPGIDIDDPEVEAGHVLLYRGELFTGEVEERMGGVVISRDSYVDGVLHGDCREWYQDGTLLSEGTARAGRPAGVSRTWHPNGTLASEHVFSDDGLTLLEERRWDEQGQSVKDWRESRRGGRGGWAVTGV